MFCPKDEKIVVADPVAAGQPLPEGRLGLRRVLRLHVAEAIRDAVHVDVHADAGLVEALGDHEVGGLSPDALEGEEPIDVVRHQSPEPLQEIPADAEEDARLGAVEAHGEDGALDPLGGQPPHRLRRVGEGKQAGRRRPRGLVLGPEREETGDEHAKGVAALRGHFGHRRLAPARGVPGQGLDDPANLDGPPRSAQLRALILARSALASGTSFIVQSARLKGAFSSSTASSSRFASAPRPFFRRVRARPRRMLV